MTMMEQCDPERQLLIERSEKNVALSPGLFSTQRRMRGTPSGQKTWPTTFKEAFCERFDCPPEQFERRLFRRCLYRHAMPLAALIYWIDPDMFREDFDFIREIGSVKDADVFQVELNRFYGATSATKAGSGERF